MEKEKIVLYAQPVDEFPYLKKNSLKEQEFEEAQGLFGAIPFTEVGEEAWRATKSLDKDASIKLVKAGFLGVPWTILFYTERLKAVVSCEKYTKGRVPTNIFLKMRLEGNEKVLRRFVRRVINNLEDKPWKMSNWKAFEERTGKGMRSVISAWKRYSEKVQTVKKKKLPEVVEASTEVDYRQDEVVFKVRVNNLMSRTIKDLTVTLDADKEMLETEGWEQGVPRLNSTGTYTAMFRLKPKCTLLNEPIKSILRFNDGKKKKRTLKDVEITVAPPKLKGVAIKRADLDRQLNRYSKKEERGSFQRRPAPELFNDMVGDLGKVELYLLEPKVERRGGTYTGEVDLYGKDDDGVDYDLRVRVQGDHNESKVVLTLFSSDVEKLVGFKQFVKGLEAFKGIFKQD